MRPALRSYWRWFMRGPFLDIGGAFLLAAVPPRTPPPDRLLSIATAAGGAPLDNLAVEAREWDALCSRCATGGTVAR